MVFNFCFILSDFHIAKEWRTLSTLSWYFCGTINSERKRICVTISDCNEQNDQVTVWILQDFEGFFLFNADWKFYLLAKAGSWPIF